MSSRLPTAQDKITATNDSVDVNLFSFLNLVLVLQKVGLDTSAMDGLAHPTSWTPDNEALRIKLLAPPVLH